MGEVLFSVFVGLCLISIGIILNVALNVEQRNISTDIKKK